MNDTPRVLAVDDDPSILRLVRAALESEGYVVASATDGESAVQAFDAGKPDLVLLDITMPGRDGFGVLQHIRQHSEVPVVFLSARADVQDVAQGLTRGADDYVTKPFSTALLLARVRAILRRYAV